MQKHKKGVMAILCFCMGMFSGLFFSNVVYAEEMQPESKIFYTMDEEGRIYEIEPEVGIVPYEPDAVSTMSVDSKTKIQVVNFNTKGNAVTTYKEMYTGADGYVNGSCGADAAYLGTKDGKVCFMISGVVGYVDASQVQVVDLSSVKTLSCYEISDGWLVHRLCFNLNSTAHGGSIRVGKTPSYLKAGIRYYSYDGHYFYTDYGQMLDDYKNENRYHSVNAQEPYYNYFQYLPFRSKTIYSKTDMDTAIENTLQRSYGDPAIYKSSKMLGIGSNLVNCQNKYGVNALLMAGIGANESGWGMSKISQTKNNLFGLNAVDSSPQESANYFKSVDVCIQEFAQIWLSKGYLNPNDFRYFGGFLGNKASGCNVKYASDPYWGEKAASVAWNMDESMNGADQYGYTIAVKDIISTLHHNVPIFADNKNSANTLYFSGNQSCTAFLIKEDAPQNGFYQIQSDGIVNSTGNGLNPGTGEYSFSKMEGYIPVGLTTVVNQGVGPKGIDRFRDVSHGSWYYNYVQYVYEKEIMTGLDDQTFGTEEKVKRAQFATIIYRMAGSPKTSYKNVFPDVPKDVFYAKAAVWASKNKILTGYSSGLFGGNDPVTREQIAVILYRYAKSCGYDTSKRADLNGFSDRKKVSSYAKTAMKWAVGCGLIRGDDGKLNPSGAASRAECAAIITRFLKDYVN